MTETNPYIKDLIEAAQTEVDNHSIYVWGGSEQLCCEVSEAWIRRQEARNEGGGGITRHYRNV